MINGLIKLKGILNAIPNNELENMSLFIDNTKQIDIICLNNTSIALITSEIKEKK